MRGFSRGRIAKAIALREALPAAKHTNALRLVHGESDGLPGLVVDRYADVLVAQFLAAGVERWRDPILDALNELSGCEAIFERSDAEVRKLEGLEAARRLRARQPQRARAARSSSTASTSASTSSRARRPGSSSTSARTAQRVRALAAGREVLDGFCYTGGFSVAALAGGAKRVTGDRELRRGAGSREGEPRGQSAGRRAGRLRAGRRVRATEDAARPEREIRPDRARSAEVRADRGAGAEGGARLQGHQPVGAEAARARRAARHLLVLGRRVGRSCSSRSSPAPRSTPAATRRSSSASARPPTTPSRSNFRKAST